MQQSAVCFMTGPRWKGCTATGSRISRRVRADGSFRFVTARSGLYGSRCEGATGTGGGRPFRKSGVPSGHGAPRALWMRRTSLKKARAGPDR